MRFLRLEACHMVCALRRVDVSAVSITGSRADSFIQTTP